MSIPPLLKYLYGQGNDENIQRGKKIFGLGHISENCSSDHHFNLKIKDDAYQTVYQVTIKNLEQHNLKNLILTCSCRYSCSPICRHKAAALFYVHHLLSGEPTKKIIPPPNITKIEKPIVVKEKKTEIVSNELFLEIVDYGIGLIPLKTPPISHSTKYQNIIDKYLKDGVFQQFIRSYSEKNISIQIIKAIFINRFLKELQGSHPTIVISKNKHLITYKLSNQPFKIGFNLSHENNLYTWQMVVESSSYIDKTNIVHAVFVTNKNNEIVVFEKEDDLLTYFANYNKIKKYTDKNLPLLINEHLQKQNMIYPCEIDNSLINKTIDTPPKTIIYFENNKQSVSIKINFLYENIEIAPPCYRYYYSLLPNNQFLRIKAYKDFEKQQAVAIFQLHSSFKQINPFHLVLSKRNISKQWTILFFETLTEMNILVKNNQNIFATAHKTGKPNLKVFINYKNDFFNIHIKATIGNYTFTMVELEEMLTLEKSKIYTLSTQEEFEIPQEWISKFKNLFKVGTIENNQLVIHEHHAHLLENFEEFVQLPRSQTNIQIEKKLSTIKIPKMQKFTLRNYQKEGFKWMGILEQTKHGGLLADDMGLGKTIQMLAKLLHFYQTQKSLRAIIVCPASVMNNWINEIQKFTPSLKAIIYHGTKRHLNKDVLYNHHIILISYNTLQKDIHHFKTISFDYAILDESQYIKNPYSKTTRAVYLLQATHRMCMSGTPLQNYTFDIYAQMNFLNPGFFGSIENFKNRFAALIDIYEEKQAKDDLKNILNPFILRRTKKQVATELPQKIDTILYCEMEPKQRHIYEYYRTLYRNKLLNLIQKEDVNKHKLHVLQGLTFLRQICNSPALVKEGILYQETPVKIEVLNSHVTQQIQEHKILIFSQFVSMLSLIKKDLQKLHIPYTYLDGQTPLKERNKQVEIFQESNSCRIFLISLKAGGVGLNLTAADYIYLVDPWWNPMIEEQAIDRAHRIGQTKNIFSYRMICKNSIEEKILLLQQKKSKLAADIIAHEKGFAKNLSTNDLEFLLSD